MQCGRRWQFASASLVPLPHAVASAWADRHAGGCAAQSARIPVEHRPNLQSPTKAYLFGYPRIRQG